MDVTRYVRRESHTPYRTVPNLTGPTAVVTSPLPVDGGETSHHCVTYVTREQVTA